MKKIIKSNPRKFFRKDIPFRITALNKITELYKKIAKNKEESQNSQDDEPIDPGDFNNMTFLYIRSTESDNGTRPISGTTWLSPDLNVYPNTGTAEIMNGIEPGQRYTIECIVRNDGDVNVPAATVEIRLANPSLGWVVANSKLINITSINIPAFTSRVVIFEWIPDVEDGGHRCLCARVYSMAPYDAPEDWDNLNSRIDRHVGQQNLFIVEQEDKINLDLAINQMGINAERGNFKISIKEAGTMANKLQLMPSLEKIKLIIGKDARFNLIPRKNEIGKEIKFTLKKQKQPNIWQGRMDGQILVPLKLQIPDLNLKKNTGTVFHVLSIDTKTEDVIGGVTLVVIKK